jgi:hypothetical protein
LNSRRFSHLPSWLLVHGHLIDGCAVALVPTPTRRDGCDRIPRFGAGAEPGRLPLAKARGLMTDIPDNVDLNWIGRQIVALRVAIAAAF